MAERMGRWGAPEAAAAFAADVAILERASCRAEYPDDSGYVTDDTGYVTDDSVTDGAGFDARYEDVDGPAVGDTSAPLLGVAAAAAVGTTERAAAGRANAATRTRTATSGSSGSGSGAGLSSGQEPVIVSSTRTPQAAQAPRSCGSAVTSHITSLL